MKIVIVESKKIEIASLNKTSTSPTLSQLHITNYLYISPLRLDCLDSYLDFILIYNVMSWHLTRGSMLSIIHAYTNLCSN